MSRICLHMTKKNRESRAQNAFSPDEIISLVSVRDARRI
jgi:hypothetical protein